MNFIRQSLIKMSSFGIPVLDVRPTEKALTIERLAAYYPASAREMTELFMRIDDVLDSGVPFAEIMERITRSQPTADTPDASTGDEDGLLWRDVLPTRNQP